MPYFYYCFSLWRPGLKLQSSPSIHRARVIIPADSCRVASDSGSCSGGWCRASYEGKFGWASEKYLQNDRAGPTRDANLFVLKAVYDVVAKRSGRMYDLSKSYSEDLVYRPTSTPIRRFYWPRGADNFVYPGGPGPTQCVAAVAEVIVETINQIYSETNDPAPFAKLPAAHFSAGAGIKHLRQHIWEYDETKAKGAAHALERFNIGKQIKFSDMVPGDLFKINRDTGPGHSTIFIGYVDRAGKILERYSDDVKGVRYFSAQRSRGVDLARHPTNGLGFRTEFFQGNCPDQVTKNSEHCNVYPVSSPYRPNTGFMLHPSAWGEIGSNLRKELANRAYAARKGVPPDQDYTSLIASGTHETMQGIASDVEAELNRSVDLSQELKLEK